MSNASTKNLFPAATVVLLRDRTDDLEVLLLRRNAQLAFHGGSWVFPGGRIDPADFAQHAPGDTALAATRAAAREAEEEAGVTLAPEQLVHFAHWTTPEGRPKRFSTWFFAALATEEEITVDGGEIHAYRWMRPNEALLAQRTKELELPAPTYVTLLKLQAHTTAAAALAAVSDEPAEIFLPRYHKLGDGACSVYIEDVAYAHGDLDVPGPRHRLYMANDGWRYERDF